MSDQINLSWFKHDANARYDNKLVAAKLFFIRKYGLHAAPEPYSIFFQILENMIENKGLFDFEDVDNIIYTIWGSPPDDKTANEWTEKVTWIIRYSGLLQPCGVVLEQNSNTTKFCSNRLSTQLQHIFNRKSNKVRGGLLSAISRKNVQLKKCRDQLKREELQVDLQLLQDKLKDLDNHSSSTQLPTELQQNSSSVPLVFQQTSSNIDKIRIDKNRIESVEMPKKDVFDFASAADILTLGFLSNKFLINREWFGKKYQLRFYNEEESYIAVKCDRLIAEVIGAGKMEELQPVIEYFFEEYVFQRYPMRDDNYTLAHIEHVNKVKYLPEIAKK